MSLSYPLPRSMRRTEFVATANQKVFGPTSGYLIFDATDVVVKTRPNQAVPWTTVVATVTLSATPGYATATFAIGLSAGTLVRIETRRVHPRTTDVTRAGALSSAMIERELDLQTSVLQELRRDVDFSDDAAAAASNALALNPTLAVNYITLASMAALTIPVGVLYANVQGRASIGDGGAGLLRRQAISPGHAWSGTSNGGTVWWEYVGPTVTPEQGGFTDLQAAVTAFSAVPGYAEMYLDRRARTTTANPLSYSAKITGPGVELVTHLGTEQRVGDDLTRSQEVNNPQRVLQNARKAVNTSRPAELSCDMFRTTAQSTANITYLAVTASDYRDRCGAVDPGALDKVFMRSGWRRIRVSGKVSWAANATGVRQVASFINGSLADSINVAAVAGGVTTDQVFDFVVDVASGDQIDVRVWQNTGGALDVLSWRYTMEVIACDIAMPRGERGLIFQGSWSAIETSAGGFDGLALNLAQNKDTFILSGIETYNDDFALFAQTPKKMWYNCIGPWSVSTAYTVGQRVHSVAENLMFICLVGHTSPGSGTMAAYRSANPTHWRAAVPGDLPQVQSLGYGRMRRLIREIKRINPNAEVWGYVSAASDTPYWDIGGNPQVGYRPLTMALAGGNLNNVAFLVQQWIKGGLDIDGIFFDHAEATFIDATVLDNAISICTAFGLPVAHNITAPGAAQVQFITKSGQVRPGHMWVVEGAYRDGGIDTLAATNAMLAEIAKHRGRQIRLFFATEEAAPFRGNVGTPGNGAFYNQVGFAVTVTNNNSAGVGTAHTLLVGDKVFVEPLSGTLPSGVYTVTSATTTTFAFTAGVSLTTGGACDLYTRGLSRLTMDTASLNNLNGKSLFDSFKRPGDAYQYSRTSYDTFN
jgi:hypothetical protein